MHWVGTQSFTWLRPLASVDVIDPLCSPAVTSLEHGLHDDLLVWSWNWPAPQFAQLGKP